MVLVVLCRWCFVGVRTICVGIGGICVGGGVCVVDCVGVVVGFMLPAMALFELVVG